MKGQDLPQSQPVAPGGSGKDGEKVTSPSSGSTATTIPTSNNNNSTADVKKSRSSVSSSSSGNGNGKDKNTSANAKMEEKLNFQKEKFLRVKEKLSKTKAALAQEKSNKNKLYKGLIKLAAELKDAHEECNELKQAQKQHQDTMSRNWYEGGMWRGPELLPGIQARARERMIHMRQQQQRGGDSGTGTGGDKTASDSTSSTEGNVREIPRRGKSAVSLSDLFFDLVIVTAFTRVGVAIQDRGGLEPASLSYFIVFWLIWGKEASFSTRFDTTDLSSQVETLLTCFAVLFGSLSSTAPFDSGDATRMMVLAAFVALLHFFLHMRVWFWFRDVNPMSEMVAVKNYAIYIMILTCVEFLTWMFGILALSETSKYRGVVFFVAIILSFRLPRTFLPNDFHAACSKRGVLFILLLGFILQSIVIVASPFFDYQMPSSEQYVFLGLVCLLLFCIKLLYVDDSFSVDPSDHALLVSRAAGFFFHLGQLALLLSTTVLGAGLNLLTHSYLAATSALPDNAKSLVCGGFAGVIFSIGFIKSMHLRRVPLNQVHRQLFYAAYGTQILVLLGVVYTTVSMSVGRFVGQVMTNELQMLGVLCGLALFLLLISWLDGVVELNIYGEGDAREFRVHPFGLWTCLKPGDPQPPLSLDTKRLSHLSPLLKDSNANLFDSQPSLNIYGSIGSAGSGLGISGSNSMEEDSEKTKSVKFTEEKGEGADMIV